MNGARNGEQPAPTLTDVVRAEQVRLLFADGSSYLSTLASSITLAGILIWQQTLEPPVAVVWLSFLALHTVARLVLRAAYLRAKPPVSEWRRWGWWFVSGCIVSGLTWAAVLPLLLAEGRFDL